MRLARRSALTYKAKNSEIVVVENFDFEAPKTKSFAEIAMKLGVGETKALFVMTEIPYNVRLSVRNLPKQDVLEARKLNTYQVLDARKLVLTEDAVVEINETFEA